MQGRRHHGHGHGHGRGGGGGFTHFASLPFIRNTHRLSIKAIQKMIQQIWAISMNPRLLRGERQTLMHLTLGMLSLPDNQMQVHGGNIYDQLRGQIEQEMKHTSLTFSKISYFSKYRQREKQREVTVLYLEPDEDKQLQKLKKVIAMILGKMIKDGIIKEKDFGSLHIHYNKEKERFERDDLHMTLFRVSGAVMVDQQFLQIMDIIQQEIKPIRFECDSVDISIRFKYDQTQFYAPLARIKLE